MYSSKSYNPKRATTSPFPETWLTMNQVEAIRAEELADDIEFERDMATLCLCRIRVLAVKWSMCCACSTMPRVW